jgi:hypothetical protein
MFIGMLTFNEFGLAGVIRLTALCIAAEKINVLIKFIEGCAKKPEYLHSYSGLT